MTDEKQPGTVEVMSKSRHKRLAIQSGLAAGDRVRFARAFLRSTGQVTGPEEPTSIGPFARGAVVGGIDLRGGRKLLTVRWDDGEVSAVLDVNLVREDRVHLEAP